MNLFKRQRRTTLFLASVLAVAALIVVVAPGVSYAQFGGLMGAVKGKALEALTNKVMDELEKKFKESVSKQPISEAAKADIVKKLSDMSRPIVKKFIDAAGSGSLPNPADLVKTVLSDVLPRIPELVAAAKAEGGGTAVATAPQATPAQYQSSAPAPNRTPTQYAAPAVPPAAPVLAPPPEKPKIAVYAFGAEDPALNKAMTTRLVVALNNSGRFQAVDNYKELFEQAAETQKSGAVVMGSKQFKKLGEQFGAEHICVAEITTVFGEKQVSAHILKAGATGIVAIGAADVPLKALIDLTTAAEQITEAMFKNINFGSIGDTKGRKTDGRTDNKTYKTINIGGRTWMAENLNHATPSGSWCYYGNDGSNCDKYGGRLYDWNTAKSVCPFGWHLPSKQEWSDMVTAAGGSSEAGKKLKSTSGWINSTNVNGNSNASGMNGTDDYGFSALPGGYRANNGGFGNAGNGGNWWTSTENGNAYAYAVRMSSYDDSVDETYNYRDYGFSVRCVQD